MRAIFTIHIEETLIVSSCGVGSWYISHIGLPLNPSFTAHPEFERRSEFCVIFGHQQTGLMDPKRVVVNDPESVNYFTFRAVSEVGAARRRTPSALCPFFPQSSRPKA